MNSKLVALRVKGSRAAEDNKDNNSPWESNTKLEFPMFDGDDFKGWLLRWEYFFEVSKILPGIELR